MRGNTGVAKRNIGPREVKRAGQLQVAARKVQVGQRDFHPATFERCVDLLHAERMLGAQVGHHRKDDRLLQVRRVVHEGAEDERPEVVVAVDVEQGLGRQSCELPSRSSRSTRMLQ